MITRLPSYRVSLHAWLSLVILAPTLPAQGIDYIRAHYTKTEHRVPMRDGARLKADVFRPKDGGKVPALLNFGPYQKDKPWTPPANLEEKPNEWMNWETVNPEWWVPRGYASVRVDARGTGFGATQVIDVDVTALSGRLRGTAARGSGSRKPGPARWPSAGHGRGC